MLSTAGRKNQVKMSAFFSVVVFFTQNWFHRNDYLQNDEFLITRKKINSFWVVNILTKRRNVYSKIKTLTLAQIRLKMGIHFSFFN